MMIKKIKKVINSIKNYDDIVTDLELVKEQNQNITDELECIKNISETRLQDIFRLQIQNKEKEDLLVLKFKDIKKLEAKIIEKEKQRRSSAGKVGVLTKCNKKLNDELNLVKYELKETNEKLKESMTDKYLVKKLPPAKAPKTKMITRPQKIKPPTRKFMAKEFEK